MVTTLNCLRLQRVADQILIRWTPGSWKRSSMQSTNTTIVQERAFAVTSCGWHSHPSCRCMINARYSSRIIEANQYGRALHPPLPKFRLLSTSPICALPSSCIVYIEVIAAPVECAGGIKARQLSSAPLSWRRPVTACPFHHDITITTRVFHLKDATSCSRISLVHHRVIYIVVMCAKFCDDA